MWVSLSLDKCVCPRSDETHQENVRRRLSYIHEEMKIYCDCLIVSSYKLIKRYHKILKDCIPKLKKSVSLGERAVKVQL